MEKAPFRGAFFFSERIGERDEGHTLFFRLRNIGKTMSDPATGNVQHTAELYGFYASKVLMLKDLLLACSHKV